MKKLLLSAIGIILYLQSLSGASITVSTVYKGTGSAYSTNTNAIIVTVPISGSSFKFQSANPADVTFSGNNIAGNLSFTSGGQLYSYNGVISRKAATGSTDNGYYFYETTVLGGSTATGQAWLLVVPSREGYITNNSSIGTNSSGVGTGIEALRLAQSLNTPPVITSDGGALNASVSVVEGSTAVTDVNATDAENNIATYTITGGVDMSKFTINTANGVLSFVTAPDYENPTDVGLDNKYNVQVTVTDAQGASDVQDIQVTVTNINDNTPDIISNGGGTTGVVNILQNAITVTTVSATDKDAGDVIVYSISGGADAALFTIDPVTGKLVFKSAAQLGSYVVQVKATDVAAHYDTQTLTVNVSATDQTPPTVTISSSDNLLASGESCNITFKFSELIQGFTSSDIQTQGGNLSGLQLNLSDPTIYNAILTQSGSGVNPTIIVNNDTYTDLNNNNGTGNTLVLSYDIIAPSVVVSLSSPNIANGETKIVTFTFSEDPTTTFTVADITLSNGELYNLIQTADPKVWTASVKATSSVAAPVVTVINNSYSDLAGNLGSGGTNSFTLVPPAIDLANISTSDTGLSQTDNITTIQKPVLVGVSTDNNAVIVTVEYYVNSVLNTLTYSGVSVSSLSFTLDLAAVTPSTGTMPESGLPEGYVTIKITTNGGAVATNSFLIDRTNPATPTINNYSGYDNTPVLSGTAVLADGDVLKVTVNGITYTGGDGNLTVNGNAWTLNIPFENRLSVSSYTVTARIQDLAGNYTTGTGTVVIQAVALTVNLQHNAISDTGVSSSDDYTSNQQPVIVGTVSGVDSKVNIIVSAGGISYKYNNVNVVSGQFSLDLSSVSPSEIIPPGSFPAYGLPAGLVTLQVEGVTSGAIATGSFTVFISYTTTEDGDWTADSKWDTNSNPNSGSAKTEIKNNITIPESTSIIVDEIIIDKDGSLHNSSSGHLTVNSNIILKVGSNNVAAKFKNNGNITNNGKVIIRKSFNRSFGWYFMSFPFDVSADKIFIAGTNTVARWGDPTLASTSTKDFYVSEYDGAKRDNTGVVNYVSDSPNWKDVSPHVLEAKKGYIIAVPGDIEIDFVSGSGEVALFSSASDQVALSEFKNNALQLHNSWNLVGTPYASAYNLNYASQPPFYHFNNVNYDVVMDYDDLVIDPYTSFFVQAANTSMTFDTQGKSLARSSVATKSADELNLSVIGSSYSDLTRIRIDDNASLDYRIGEDAVKMFSPVTGVPQLYSKIGNYPIAVNTLPRSLNVVDLILKTPVTGSYKLVLNKPELVKSYASITLIDNVTGMQQDLIKNGEYTFTTTITSALNRFKIILSNSVTATGDDLSTEKNLIAFGDEGKVFINGIQNISTVKAYNLSGNIIAEYRGVENLQPFYLNYKGLVILHVVDGNKTYNVKINL